MPVSRLQLSENGPECSRLVQGFWRLAEWGLSDQELLRLIETCLDLGITTLDHADIYGEYQCERLFGRALRLKPALRDRMELITKCGIKIVTEHRPEHALPHYDTSTAHIIESAERSLELLGTDRIDLLLIHRPDPLMNADAIAEAFVHLRDAGKVLHFGVSNFTPFQFDLLASRLPFPLVTNQVECSVLQFDVMHDGTLDQCQRLRIAPMAWSPFAGGDVFTADTEQARRVRTALQELGDEHGGASLDQVALAWLMRHPAQMLPIIGTGKTERIRSAANAFDLSLTRQQWFTLWSASTGTPVP